MKTGRERREWRNGGWHWPPCEADMTDPDILEAMNDILERVRERLADVEPGTRYISSRYSGGKLYEFIAVAGPEVVASGKVWPAVLDKSYQYGRPSGEFGEPIEVVIRT